MEMQSGSEITADSMGVNTTGGAITIAVPNGDFIMRGTGTAAPALSISCATVAGACISSSNLSGTGKGGTVKITVGNFPTNPPEGLFTMEPGSAVLVNSLVGSGGAIEILAGLKMDVDGLVRSFGGVGGGGSAATQPPGGGPITLKAGCQLAITPDGVKSSEGHDPGADPVHSVKAARRRSTGSCSQIAYALFLVGTRFPPTRRTTATPTPRPSRTFAYTACVEIWANNITINGICRTRAR